MLNIEFMDKQTQKTLLKTVNKNYQEIADDFAKTRQKFLWPGLLRIAKIVKEDEKILDIGCGNGRLLQAFENSINYLGIDKSSNLIKIAKKENQGKNINFKQGCILNLGAIPEHNFDYIFCIAVLHHLPGQDLQIQAIKQLKNKVKPNGKIIITVWNLWAQKKYRNLIWKFWLLKLINKNKMDFGDILFDWKKPNSAELSQRYYHAFRKSELKKIIKKSGLKITEIHSDKHNIYLVLEK
jgi:2-polyprenyl-3-methyl-5-hydroxy-6-metoxy-1,4-benzoquinol methylase